MRDEPMGTFVVYFIMIVGSVVDHVEAFNDHRVAHAHFDFVVDPKLGRSHTCSRPNYAKIVLLVQLIERDV